MSGRLKDRMGESPEYAEESVKPALLALLVVVAVVSLPFGWGIHRMGQEGFILTDTSRFAAMAGVVSQDVQAVRRLLENERVDERILKGAAATPVVTLITPNVAPTNMDEAVKQDPRKLNVELKAIYWSTRDPIVTIGDENYKVGEKIGGFTIEEIRKTEVVFRSPFGDKVVKYFYDYLDESRR